MPSIQALIIHPRDHNEKKNSAFLKLAAATALLVLLGFLGAASVSSSLFGDGHPPLYLRRLPGPSHPPAFDLGP